MIEPRRSPLTAQPCMPGASRSTLRSTAPCRLLSSVVVASWPHASCPLTESKTSPSTRWPYAAPPSATFSTKGNPLPASVMPSRLSCLSLCSDTSTSSESDEASTEGEPRPASPCAPRPVPRPALPSPPRPRPLLEACWSSVRFLIVTPSRVAASGLWAVTLTSSSPRRI
eukprot:scaffold112554_cov63-Phaeocystis_antarctica.AAC.4